MTTIEEYEAALMPIIEQFGQDVKEAIKRMGEALIPIAKALEASPIDKAYKDALANKISRRLSDIENDMDGIDFGV